MSDDPRLTQWNERYATDDYIFGEAPNAFLAAQAALLRPGMTALAVADGEGRNGVWLAKQGLDVLAVDFSPVALAKSRKLAAREGVAVRTECADLLTWDWGRERFDADRRDLHSVRAGGACACSSSGSRRRLSRAG